MSIRKKINPPNDFWMNIIDFPPSTDEFKSLHFPETAIVWAKEIEQQIELLVNQKLRDFGDLQSFVKAQFENRQIKFVKIDIKDGAHYVCFGDDPDSLENSISFRIDQDWNNFVFPQDFDKSTIEYLKSLVASLSGAIIGRLDFPEIILSKKWIGNPKICYGYDGKGNIVNAISIQKAIDDFFLVAVDYWSVATIVDKLGLVWLWNTRNQKEFEIQSTGLNVKEWFQAELQNPFRQRAESKWVRQKTAQHSVLKNKNTREFYLFCAVFPFPA